MDGAGTGSELKDLSRAQNFAQRVVTSSFAMNVLGIAYKQRDSHRKLIGPAAYEAIGTAWKRGETDKKKISDAARYFEEWHSLKKPASPQTLADLIAYRPGLEYVRGLERLGNLNVSDLRQFSYVATAGACLEVMDSTRSERKKSAVDVRADLARGILDTIRHRWTPDAEGRIHLPGLAIGGLAGSSESCDPVAGQAHRLLAPFVLHVSGDAIRNFPAHADSSCVDYLVSLAMDAEPLPMDVMVRWAIDLTSAMLATRCLQRCEFDPQSHHRASNHSSNLAYDTASIEGLALWLLGPPRMSIPEHLICSVVERTSAPVKSERVLRALWGNFTLIRTRRALEWLWSMLGVDVRYFLRAFERQTLPVLPIKATATGTEIARHVRLLLKPGVADTILQPCLSPPPAAACANPIGNDWIATYRRVSRGFAKHLGRLAEIANKEGRLLLRSEYEELLSRMESDRAILHSKTPPASIQRIRTKVRGIRDRSSTI